MTLTAQQTDFLTLVVSAGQSRNPDKRLLEESLARLAAELPGVAVLRVPHLYDLPRDSETYQRLKNIQGDLIVVSWLFDRATHWILDRNGVRGQVGEVLLRDETDEDEQESPATDGPSDECVVDSQPRPSRNIYCIDFRAS